MNEILIVVSIIIFLCVFLNRISSKFGIPVLLAFMVLGIIIKAMNPRPYESMELEVMEKACSVALIFIMFYGGFGTRLESARPVIFPASVLSTVGVAMTAALVGLFCHFVLAWGWAESFVMGSVISSTDAASVFAILRSRRLGLKNNIAPMLEVESGSNDPMSYMLTVVSLSFLNGSMSGGAAVLLIFKQLVIGGVGGWLLAKLMLSMMNSHLKPAATGFDSVMIVAVAIFSYAVPSALGGNGYLSVYIVGIMLGNYSSLVDRKTLASFFDGVTSMMQIFIFYMLGTCASVGSIHSAILPALAIFIFLSLVARPASVCSVLSLCKPRYPLWQQTFVSFVGLRGAASIVFAMMVVNNGVELQHDIFNIVFCIVLISILLQGSLIPSAARKLNIVDDEANVLKTFTDFSEEEEMSFGQIEIDAASPWKNHMVRDLDLPKNLLLVLLLRGNDRILPKGHTTLLEGDVVILCTKSYSHVSSDSIYQHRVGRNSKWAGHTIKEYPYKTNCVIVLINRGTERIIPNGDTVIEENDLLTIFDRNSKIRDFERQ